MGRDLLSGDRRAVAAAHADRTVPLGAVGEPANESSGRPGTARRREHGELGWPGAAEGIGRAADGSEGPGHAVTRGAGRQLFRRPEHDARDGQAVACRDRGKLRRTAREADMVVEPADAIDQTVFAHAVQLDLRLDVGFETQQQILDVDWPATQVPGTGTRRLELLVASGLAGTGEDDRRGDRER